MMMMKGWVHFIQVTQPMKDDDDDHYDDGGSDDDDAGEDRVGFISFRSRRL